MAEHGCESKAKRYDKVNTRRPCNGVAGGNAGHGDNVHGACDADPERKGRVGDNGLRSNGCTVPVRLSGGGDLQQTCRPPKDDGLCTVWHDLSMHASGCGAAPFWRKAGFDVASGAPCGRWCSAGWTTPRHATAGENKAKKEKIAVKMYKTRIRVN